MVGETNPPIGPWGPHEPPAGDGLGDTAVPQSLTQPATPLKSTDFLAAQHANRRNTVVLVMVLLALGGTFGYLLGLVVDAWGNDPASFDALSVSSIGVLGAAIFVGIGA